MSGSRGPREGPAAGVLIFGTRAGGQHARVWPCGRVAVRRVRRGLCACLGLEERCHASPARAEAPVAMAIANRGSCDLNRERGERPQVGVCSAAAGRRASPGMNSFTSAGGTPAPLAAEAPEWTQGRDTENARRCQNPGAGPGGAPRAHADLRFMTSGGEDQHVAPAGGRLEAAVHLFTVSTGDTCTCVRGARQRWGQPPEPAWGGQGARALSGGRGSRRPGSRAASVRSPRTQAEPRW